MTVNIGMIGVGNMAGAIAKALHRAHPDIQLHLYHRHSATIAALATALDARIYDREALPELLKRCDFIFIGVKPKDLKGLFAELTPILPEDVRPTWVSMAVGTSLATLATLTPAGQSWIRIMPNTPIELGQGFTAYAFGSDVSEDRCKAFTQLLEGTGQAIEIPESHFDIVSAIAGSGPAFIYLLIEAMTDAGIYHGLKGADAQAMVLQTLIGAAQMVRDKAVHPAILKSQVTSPGGTTVAGLASLEKNAFRSAILEAITATVEKTLAK